ncbi:integrase, partial [Klebsiella pneumoniae]
GFRHTLSTILHEKGYERAEIEMQLAHIDKNNIRGIYNHAQYLNRMGEMMDWYSSYIFQC